ncbi:MAG: hypothetical protein WC763_06595 [Candidatus Paceibacterota bacterium]|jgi:uncharacterized membrane protein YvbJ
MQVENDKHQHRHHHHHDKDKHKKKASRSLNTKLNVVATGMLVVIALLMVIAAIVITRRLKRIDDAVENFNTTITKADRALSVFSLPGQKLFSAVTASS